MKFCAVFCPYFFVLQKISQSILTGCFRHSSSFDSLWAQHRPISWLQHRLPFINSPEGDFHCYDRDHVAKHLCPLAIYSLCRPNSCIVNIGACMYLGSSLCSTAVLASCCRSSWGSLASLPMGPGLLLYCSPFQWFGGICNMTTPDKPFFIYLLHITKITMVYVG